VPVTPRAVGHPSYGTALMQEPEKGASEDGTKPGPSPPSHHPDTEGSTWKREMLR